MRQRIALLLLVGALFASSAFAQKKKIYDPSLNGKKQLLEAVTKAQATGKNVFVQVGGNWCSWCIKFEKFVNFNNDLGEILEKNYITVHLNYSKSNKNWDALEQLGFPQRFGFPVFVILDKNGNRIHTQDSGYLEKDGGYDHDKVKRFLENWTPKALSAESYKDKK
ncbi:thioredoxin family protein [Fulvitalea axinellae]|uniref:Thioredoxin family protein n=1 Tax=Fulvitalea axinellae TaxID=1182444 RepID=A0AAU9CZS4_9BACT|nr:thioredoxin family protein [Fulvitalea axinellae]